MSRGYGSPRFDALRYSFLNLKSDSPTGRFLVLGNDSPFLVEDGLGVRSTPSPTPSPQGTRAHRALRNIFTNERFPSTMLVGLKSPLGL